MQTAQSSLQRIIVVYFSIIRIDNNAALLARRIYLTDLELFDRVWEREGRNLRLTIERVVALAKDAKDPYAAVKAWLGES